MAQTKRNQSLDSKKKDAVRTARQLYYPDSVIDRIMAAPNEAQIQIAMTTARHEWQLRAA